MTAGLAAVVASGGDLAQGLALGSAAGAVNVTRHGLATGQRATIEAVAARTVLRPVTAHGKRS